MEDPLKAPEHPTGAATANCLDEVGDCETRDAFTDCVEAMGRSSNRREDGGSTASTSEGQWTPYAWSSCSSVESSKFSIERKGSVSN